MFTLRWSESDEPDGSARLADADALSTPAMAPRWRSGVLDLWTGPGADHARAEPRREQLDLSSAQLLKQAASEEGTRPPHRDNLNVV